MCESEKFLRKIGQQVAFAIAHSQQKAPVNLQSDCFFGSQQDAVDFFVSYFSEF